jgi:hypothetical protein
VQIEILQEDDAVLLTVCSIAVHLISIQPLYARNAKLPNGSSSYDIDSLRPSTANFVLTYAEPPGKPNLPAPEQMHIPRLKEKLIQSKLRSCKGGREEHNQMCRQITSADNLLENRNRYSGRSTAKSIGNLLLQSVLLFFQAAVPYYMIRSLSKGKYQE